MAKKVQTQVEPEVGELVVQSIIDQDSNEVVEFEQHEVTKITATKIFLDGEGHSKKTVLITHKRDAKRVQSLEKKHAALGAKIIAMQEEQADIMAELGTLYIYG